MIQVHTFVFNPFQENTYLVYDESGNCLIIDPGCSNAAEEKMLSDFIAHHRLVPSLLINTHCHIDHVLGNNFVAEKYSLPLYLHQEELKTYRETDRWTAMFGLPPLTPPKDQKFLAPGEQLKLGDSTWEILFTPGHSIASVSLFEKKEGILFAGDVLFKEGVGRTDLPGGNFQVLASSIQRELYVLPGETRVFPGHGESTTIAHEKLHNPFVSYQQNG